MAGETEPREPRVTPLLCLCGDGETMHLTVGNKRCLRTGCDCRQFVPQQTLLFDAEGRHE